MEVQCGGGGRANLSKNYGTGIKCYISFERYHFIFRICYATHICTLLLISFITNYSVPFYDLVGSQG